MGQRGEELAERFGTPLYVYSYYTLIDHYMKLKEAFAEIEPLICFSVKANSNLAILKALVDKGAGRGHRRKKEDQGPVRSHGRALLFFSYRH